MSDILFQLPHIVERAEEEYTRLKNEGWQEGEIDAFEKIESFGESTNHLAEGDNLRYMLFLLREGWDESFRVIYADPPFFSKSDYSIHVRVGDRARRLVLAKNHAFTDRWEEGMAGYLTEMTVRILLMKDLLATDGTFFMHLDWHSSHYMKVILDHIFGEKHFINEIVWHYKSGGVSKRYFARKHDVILFYSKGDVYPFFVQQEKSYNRDRKPYHFKGVREYRDDLGWYTMVSMKDVWQLDMVGRTSSERTGYATQKPEALLERILTSVTETGDLCGDFFCGSGTLGAVCARMGRRYVMCDNSTPAVMMTHKRLAQLTSGHVLWREKKSISANLRVTLTVERIQGVEPSVGIGIAGLSYEDVPSLGIEEKNLPLMDTVVRYHYDQLIDYWCVDTQYDGEVVKPTWVQYRKKDGIDITVVIPRKEIVRCVMRVIDVFGNEVLQEVEIPE